MSQYSVDESINRKRPALNALHPSRPPKQAKDHAESRSRVVAKNLTAELVAKLGDRAPTIAVDITSIRRKAPARNEEGSSFRVAARRCFVDVRLEYFSSSQHANSVQGRPTVLFRSQTQGCLSQKQDHSRDFQLDLPKPIEIPLTAFLVISKHGDKWERTINLYCRVVIGITFWSPRDYAEMVPILVDDLGQVNSKFAILSAEVPVSLKPIGSRLIALEHWRDGICTHARYGLEVDIRCKHPDARPSLVCRACCQIFKLSGSFDSFKQHWAKHHASLGTAHAILDTDGGPLNLAVPRPEPRPISAEETPAETSHDTRHVGSNSGHRRRSVLPAAKAKRRSLGSRYSEDRASITPKPAQLRQVRDWHQPGSSPLVLRQRPPSRQSERLAAKGAPGLQADHHPSDDTPSHASRPLPHNPQRRHPTNEAPTSIVKPSELDAAKTNPPEPGVAEHSSPLTPPASEAEGPPPSTGGLAPREASTSPSHPSPDLPDAPKLEAPTSPPVPPRPSDAPPNPAPRQSPFPQRVHAPTAGRPTAPLPPAAPLLTIRPTPRPSTRAPSRKHPVPATASQPLYRTHSKRPLGPGELLSDSDASLPPSPRQPPPHPALTPADRAFRARFDAALRRDRPASHAALPAFCARFAAANAAWLVQDPRRAAALWETMGKWRCEGVMGWRDVVAVGAVMRQGAEAGGDEV